MYDNVDFKLKITDFSGIDFLEDVPKHLYGVRERTYEGEFVIIGTLKNDLCNNNYRVTVNRNGVNIRDGSLCKYYLGDNFQTLGRGDTQRAMEKMSDTLHLPIDKAVVSRIDVAQNFIVRHSVENYYNHLGEWHNGNKKSTRAPITNNMGIIEGMYYYQRLGLLVFYDKIKEQKAKRQPIPELYQGRHVLRYEQRHKKRLPEIFNVEKVTVSMLYNEKFYIDLLNRWKENYFAIKKINDITLNFETMRTKTDLYNLGVLALVQMAGGELNFISQMQEAKRTGVLTKKQAFDLKQAVIHACKERSGITDRNDCILELDKKVKEAVKFYR